MKNFMFINFHYLFAEEKEEENSTGSLSASINCTKNVFTPFHSFSLALIPAIHPLIKNLPSHTSTFFETNKNFMKIE